MSPFNDSVERASIKRKPSATSANKTNNLVKLSAVSLLAFGSILLHSLTGGVASGGNTSKDIQSVLAGYEMTEGCANSGCIKVVTGVTKGGLVVASGSTAGFRVGQLGEFPICEITSTGSIHGSGCALASYVTISGAGVSQAGNDLRYVKKQGDTMTGGLLIHSTNDATKTVDAGILLEVAGTMSGTEIFVNNKISTSGSLTVKGVPRLQTDIVIPLCDGATACATGSGVMVPIPTKMNTFKLNEVLLACGGKGTTGTMSVQVINITDGVDLFSTKFTVDSQEADSSSAATPGVINTSGSADVVTSNDLIMARVDAVHTTPCKAASIRLLFVPQ